MADYTWMDLEALRPEWEAAFDGAPMPMGFEVTPDQVPVLRKCIARKSQEPLDAYVSGLDEDLIF